MRSVRKLIPLFLYTPSQERMRPDRGYYKRLPSFIQTALSGFTETYQEDDGTPIPHPGNWGNVFSVEPQVLKLDLSHAWDFRITTIRGGGLKVVKFIYETIIAPAVLKERNGEYTFEDLSYAIMYGHKKIFWYLLDLFKIHEHFDADEMLYHWVLTPLIKMGRSDWFAEYNKRYPDTLGSLPDILRDELIAMALQLQDAWVIYELVKAGLSIDQRLVNMAYIITSCEATEAHKKAAMRDEGNGENEGKAEHTTGKVDVIAEYRGMENALYPVVSYLRKKYPKRVEQMAVSMLLPHIPEIDDEDEDGGSEDDEDEDGNVDEN